MRLFLACLVLVLSAWASADEGMGHSRHGSAFDSGMRTRPWEMQGIGSAPFPITTRNPEVQKWFNQGNALLHSFWFEEAERSFRWCLKLDPGCAMAYWGLARCGFNWFTMALPEFDEKGFGRYKTFLREAVRIKGRVPERERLYIEAWERATAPGITERPKVLVTQLQNLIIRFPDDLEAKALLALFNIGQGSAFANQLVINEVLAKSPMHPGAHHAAIHNWDGVASEQGIASCEKYGRAAPAVGHALHMPGHIYSKIGMWHEAAIAMDSATRMELRYMNDRLALPFETWNYPHNRNYLCYIQEQLGMAEVALQGARDLLAAPRDPELNSIEIGGAATEGQIAMIRALIKFERWKEILTPGVIPWNANDPLGNVLKSFTETLAHHGLGNKKEATEGLELLKKRIGFVTGPINDPSNEFVQTLMMLQNTAEGLIDLANGNIESGQKALRLAAERDAQYVGGDPPMNPWRIIRLLGDDYRARGDYPRAIECYTQALKEEPNDAFTLSGLALAHHAAGDLEKAKVYAGRLEYVWSQADPQLRWLEEVRKLGLKVKPIAETPRPERVYRPQNLDRLGPMNWQPFAAPSLQVRDVNGKPVTLKDYSGKNVLLVFFLGDTCVHCVGQLKSIHDRMSEFQAQNTVVLAVCSSSPESLKSSTTLEEVKITYLSDTAHENARRFSSYDDFEEMELHSTILIDSQGRVRWKRTGGDPFMNMGFLLNELKRINDSQK